MAATTLKELLEAGCHFGAAAQNWNPRMKPFIHGKRNRIHIIDLQHTVRGLTRGQHFLTEVAATGRQIVFVCTKRQMRGLLLQEATRVEMPWVTERWLGGTLTNFKTVRSRLARLEELEAMVASGAFEELPKKLVSSLNREKRRITKNLDGLRTLNRIPGALLVIDPKREEIAVREAQRVGVPVVALLDTDCDPQSIDIPIPANDDSMRSVSLLLTKLADAVAIGVQRFKESGRMPEDAVGVRKDGEVHELPPQPEGDAAGGDKAAGDKAAGDKAAGDKAAGDKAAGDDATSTAAVGAAAAETKAEASAGAGENAAPGKSEG